MSAPAAPHLPDATSFKGFHERSVPEALTRRSSRLPDAYGQTLEPFGIRERESGRTYTLSFAPESGSIEIQRGEENAVTLIELPSEKWVGLTQDVESAPGLVYGDHATRVRGDLMDFVHWEPALRWLYLDRPVYDPSNVDLQDSHGRTLDPTRGFSPDDDPDEMAEFLRTVGYLWVRNVLSPEEIKILQQESERLRDAARPGDQESWWGKREDGSEVLCRVLRAGKEPKMRSLHGDPRLERYAELCDLPMDHKQGPGDKDGLAILWKQPRVAEGLGDLPWHRDCGMGGHASMCPTAVMSIFLGPNTKEAGQIRFLPGSWKSSFPFAEGNDAGAPEGVAPAAKPGDITLHYGDGLHVAPPPTGSEGPFRSCILMGYGRTGGGHHAGKRHYNDILLGNADGQVEDMRKIAKRR
jgi:hypothetical protein